MSVDNYLQNPLDNTHFEKFAQNPYFRITKQTFGH